MRISDLSSDVCSSDLTTVFKEIKSAQGHPGRPAIDPKIITALWLYATIEGVGSARVIGRYCKEHLAFTWLCGGVALDRKTISNFRTEHGHLFDDILRSEERRVGKGCVSTFNYR